MHAMGVKTLYEYHGWKRNVKKGLIGEIQSEMGFTINIIAAPLVGVVVVICHFK